MGKRKSTVKKAAKDVQIVTIQQSNTSGSQLNREHPLLNPLLLDNILDHMNLSFDDLKIFRQVCQLWCKVSLNKWRESAVITIVPDRQSPQLKGIPLSLFLDHFQDPESVHNFSEKPFSKYKLKGFLINENFISGNRKRCQELRNIGPLVKYLHLEKCTVPKQIEQPLYRLLHDSFTNVKDLSLNEIKYMSNWTSLCMEYIPKKQDSLKLETLTLYGTVHYKVYNYLLVTASNLQTIRGIDLPSSDNRKDRVDQSTLHVLPAILNTLATKYKADSDLDYNSDDSGPNDPSAKRFETLQLKHIDLFNSSAFTKIFLLSFMCSRLAEKCLKLETLSVQLKPNDKIKKVYGKPRGNSQGSIDLFLMALSKTLKVLKIFRAPIGAPLTTLFEYGEKMTALTELYLSGTTASTFDFLCKTPNLKKLCIDFGCYDHRDRIGEIIREKDGTDGVRYKKYRFDMALYAKPHVMEGCFLDQLTYLEVDYEFKELELLGKWMPNLTTLKTILNDATFSEACQIWGDNLTELVCLFGSTLHNSSLCKNIGHLKSLQKFGLEAYCNEAKLTDNAVYNGFLKMIDLQSVDIYVGPEMSDKAEKALRNAVKYCQIFRKCKSFGGDSTEGNECCERKEFLSKHGVERN